MLCSPETDAAVDGRLPGLGGCGNAATLTALRSDLSGPHGIPPVDVDLIVLMSEVELDVKDLLSDGLALDGVRSFDAWEGDCALEGSGGKGRLFLNFDDGNGGKDPVEGWFAAGRDG